MLALMLLGVPACKKQDKSNSIDFHFDYFPMTEGRFVIYDATEIYHDDASGIHDTSHFLLKTLVGQNYVDNAGRVGRELLRFKSFDNGLTWQTTDVWSQFVTDYRAELVEENKKLVKLVFVPSADKEWDVNVFNVSMPQNAFYSSIHDTYNVNTFTFDSTLTVVQADFFSLVDLQNQKEVYAKNVGLIQKYYKNLVIENFDTLSPKTGNEIFYNLVDFGVE